eukprot:7104701-Alexandrium_andersonii.AAC.1
MVAVMVAAALQLSSPSPSPSPSLHHRLFSRVSACISPIAKRPRDTVLEQLELALVDAHRVGWAPRGVRARWKHIPD